MKESHGEGLARHPDPESCTRGGNPDGEALTGAHVGQVLSCEIKLTQVPRPLNRSQGNTRRADMARHVWAWRSRRP